MIKADKVRFVPVSTYIFIITAGLLIHSGRSGSALTMVVGALIVARLVSSIWLFMVSKKAPHSALISDKLHRIRRNDATGSILN